MVVGSELSQEQTDRIFAALADATRRDILRRAIGGEHSVSQLALLYPMSFAAVQKHVAVLQRAELVTKERRGREQLVRTNADTLAAAGALLVELESLWRDRMDRFDRVLAEPPPASESPEPNTDQGVAP